MCRVLEVSRSGYYTWQKRPKSAREQSNTRVIVHMKAIHSKKYTTIMAALECVKNCATEDSIAAKIVLLD